MAEADWRLIDPESWLDQLSRPVGARKRRLFACACCRRIWHLLTDPRDRAAVEISERYADGRATLQDLLTAQGPGHSLIFGPRQTPRLPAVDLALFGKPSAAFEARFAVSRHAAAGPVRDGLTLATLAQEAEVRAQLAIVHDLVGHPPSLAEFDFDWLTWHDGMIPRLAQAIYDERAFERLPILADALEDAGCAVPGILEHCRSGDAHVLGCWVIDLLLGKE